MVTKINLIKICFYIWFTDAKRDIISKRREINHSNSTNVILKETQVIDDENSDSNIDTVTDIQNSKTQSDDGCIDGCIEDAEVRKQQSSTPCRRSARNKARAVADSSCIPSSRYVFTHKYNMFAVVNVFSADWN